ncbi:MAG: imidazole glycerol phosphate synthase subunit HisF [Alphaproteobacteria bacterium]|nr:imidazole glycerol phosphate synthase subunit HisF [Alphaproteobacteria bacterium]
MSTVRIIPCLDVKDGHIVKGVNFVGLRNVGDPVAQAKVYDQAGADELCFLDISASAEGKETMYDVISATADSVFLPLTVGGGVSQVLDYQRLLSCGADKVSVNSAALNDPNLIAEASQRFGAQCVVVAIDVKTVDGVWKVFSHGGRRETAWQALDWAQRITALGAGEILLTSMDRDGTGAGFDLALLAAMRQAVTVPIIASGGVGTLQHLVDGVQQGGVDAVLAASIFHFGIHSISEAKRYMANAGITVRPLVNHEG